MQRIHLTMLPAALAGVLLLAAPVEAGQETTTFQVTATVGAACTLSATDLVFGNYDGTVLSGSATLTFDCSQLVDGTLTMTGANPNADPNDGFAMVDGQANVLDYTLAFDPAQQFTLVSGQAEAVQIPAGNNPADIYGEIPAAQAAPQGSYADTVTVQFDF